jgi:hypothetical protein
VNPFVHLHDYGGPSLAGLSRIMAHTAFLPSLTIQDSILLQCRKATPFVNFAQPTIESAAVDCKHHLCEHVVGRYLDIRRVHRRRDTLTREIVRRRKKKRENDLGRYRAKHRGYTPGHLQGKNPVETAVSELCIWNLVLLYQIHLPAWSNSDRTPET